MSDRKYLDSILETIQDREYVREVGPVAIGLVAFFTYVGIAMRYEAIRRAVSKNYKKCSPGVLEKKGEKYKKCMLTAKLGGQMKALQLLNTVAPAKCKTKKDPRKCMERLKSNKAKLRAKIKVSQAKLSLIK